MKCMGDWLCDISYLMQNISQEKRLQIICMLSKTKSMCVCEIIDKLEIRQNLVSHHLKILKDLWLIKNKRDGKNIHYMIDKKKFDKFKLDLKKIFNI